MKDQTDAHQLSFKHTECIENRWYMCVFFRSLCISLVSSHSQTYTLTHAYKYIDSGKHLSIKCTRAIKLFVLHAYMSVFCCLFVWFSGCYVRFVDFIRSVRSYVSSFRPFVRSFVSFAVNISFDSKRVSYSWLQ